MPSPFLGMDPYLEAPHLWPDVHQALAARIRLQLAPLIRPNYVARLAVRVVSDDPDPAEVIIAYPDVEILTAHRLAEVAVASPARRAISVTPYVLENRFPLEVRLVSVELRDVGEERLVTSIEILSPVNKRGPGLHEYRSKCARVLAAGAHLLEIDLLRAGTRPTRLDFRPLAPYYVMLTRANRPGRTEVWPMQLPDPLPVVPAPLLKERGDPDAPLDLGEALAAIYDEAGYDLSIDYRKHPIPPLEGEEARWAEELLRAR
ncbi:MAG: DUF4058 family protein [Chloroflexi bacterium]|nr:DUF4058 family protein [Chloroflexota bacterium]